MQAEQEKVLGNTAFGKKEFKKAVLHYSMAIALDPDNHVYYRCVSGCRVSCAVCRVAWRLTGGGRNQ